MNHTMLNAGSVMNQCARFTALSVSRLKVLGSTLRINSYEHLWISKGQDFTVRLRHAHFIHMLDMPSTLLARAHQGLTPRLKGASRWVAKVSLGVLCLSGTQPAVASIDAMKSLANTQLTIKQYKCHNEIIYRESRWKIDAVNGSHHGYYQMKNKHIKGKPYDYQFYMYWYYVAKRYGITKYDEPNYCKALHHLKTKGWQ
jgi:hypothetical protein